MSSEEEQESQALIPLVQDTILFNGHPLVVVRLPDGQPGVVLRWICENLHISSAAQVERVKRTDPSVPKGQSRHGLGERRRSRVKR